MTYVKPHEYRELRQRPCRVLMVEDSPDDQILAKKNLEASEDVQEVICFSDGKALIDYIKLQGASERPVLDTIPTLIVVDLNMPQMDGFEVLRQLKAEMLLSGVPVIVVSSATSFENVRRVFELKADAFFRKPLSACNLHDFLRQGRPWPPHRGK